MPEAKTFRAIYGICREHGVDNEMLHEIVLNRFKKTSLRDLTARECRLLLDGLNGRHGNGRSGYKGTRRGAAMQADGRRGVSNPETVYLVNDRERRLLVELASLRGWSEATLQTFCLRQLHGQQLTTISQFNKILWALKAMNRRDGIGAGEAA